MRSFSGLLALFLSSSLLSCGTPKPQDKVHWAEDFSLHDVALINQSEQYLKDHGARMSFTLTCPYIEREHKPTSVRFEPCRSATTGRAYRVYYDAKEEEIVSFKEVMDIEPVDG